MRTLNFKTFIPFLASILILIGANSCSNEIKPYFNAGKISPELLNNPSLPGSKKYKKQVRHIIKLQANPDLDEVEEAFREKHLQPEMLVQFVDEKISRQDYPKLYNLLDRTHQTARSATRKAKNYWDMKRPYVAIKKIQPLIAAHANPAYPSGHTTSSYTLARVLSLVFVEQKNEFLDRAKEIAQHRVLVGMHFPQDLDAGRQLSLLVMGGLIRDEQFLEDLKKAQKEIKNK